VSNGTGNASSTNAPVRKYRLGPGGIYGRFENGIDVVYRPGDPILCDDVQARSFSLKGRLLEWKDEEPAVAATATKVVISEPAVNTPPPSPFVEPTTGTPLPATWDFVTKLPAKDVLDRIEQMDDKAAVTALRDAEKLNPTTQGGRRQIINAANKRVRQIALAHARDAKKAKLAAEEAEVATSKGEVEVEVEEPTE
jgi:hypothetical protein